MRHQRDDWRVLEEISKKILEIFPNSFINDKEIRIPYEEDGAAGQIKVTLTAAKNIVESGTAASDKKIEVSSVEPIAAVANEPTEEEKERLKTLLEKLGL